MASSMDDRAKMDDPRSDVPARVGGGNEEFLSDLGHEIRNPLNAVIGFCDLLEASGLRSTQRDHVESIRAAGLRILEVLAERTESGGRVMAASDTCFLPRPEAQAKEPEPFPEAIYESGTVLVVDDLELNRLVVRGILERLGVQVLEACDGEVGIRMARESLPDLVLMDLRMPSMGGSEAAAFLRMDARTRAIPVVAMTASVDPSALRFEDPLFAEVLEKPVAIPKLVALLDRFLPRRRVEAGDGGDPAFDPQTESVARGIVAEALESMGGAVHFPTVRSLAARIEALDPPSHPSGASALGRRLVRAAESHDVPEIGRILSILAGGPE